MRWRDVRKTYRYLLICSFILVDVGDFSPIENKLTFVATWHAWCYLNTDDGTLFIVFNPYGWDSMFRSYTANHRALLHARALTASDIWHGCDGWFTPIKVTPALAIRTLISSLVIAYNTGDVTSVGRGESVNGISSIDRRRNHYFSSVRNAFPTRCGQVWIDPCHVVGVVSVCLCRHWE